MTRAANYILIGCKQVLQGVPKKLVQFAAKTTFFNKIALIALQTAQVFFGTLCSTIVQANANTMETWITPLHFGPLFSQPRLWHA